MTISSKISKTSTNLDLLKRRDRSLFVSEQKSWSDFRAWIASCLFHTFLLILFALLWRPQIQGTSGEQDRPIGIAIAHETNQGTEYSLEGGASGATSAFAATSQSIPLAAINATGPPISIENVVAELIGNQTGAFDGNPNQDGTQGSGLSGDGGTGSSSGGGRGRGTGTKTKISFFGIEGSGSSFVYVVDRSDSMNSYDSAPLRYAKRELLKSLESLNDTNQFQIVFYNDSISPMARKMFFATDGDKRRAANFVRSMPGDGGTKHLPALRQALAMSPEVIFFLTDADESLTFSQLAEIQERADLSRTTIHTIRFSLGSAPDDGGWIRDLAVMNRGTFKYIDVSTINGIPGE